MFFLRRKFITAALIASISATIFTGCGEQPKQQAQAPKQQVKVMKVVQRDTPLSSEYAGQLVGTDEVKVQSKISGNVVEKHVVGGQYVEAGQLLFKIDDRQYQSQVMAARASLAQADVNYQNAKIDLQRNEMLLKENAIAEQTVTTQAALVKAYEAACAAAAAQVQLALENLADTEIYAPMSGQLGVDDVAVGAFVGAGTTTLVTIGSIDPIFARFTISENEYLKFMTVQSMQANHNPIHVTITLSDGREYPYEGQIVETDRELANNTGSLIMKAIFPNQGGILMPGMFARVKLSGETIPNALLVPQRAVQQLLGKSFVMCVGEDGKSVAKTIELGQQVGSYYVVNGGVTANDTIVVEGLTNLREGVDLAATEVSAGDMGFTLSNVTTPYQTDIIAGATSNNPNAPANLNQ
ncbi:MAG: efflux RND transporter periplasmic adaptor subunit [Selenomonadaceae bacterium]|nr:efflux RND transporter periplasmic adaptor subunit [Selenomonadaceae bacterium]